MSNVYVVTTGAYSDYGISAIFADYVSARRYIDSRIWSTYDDPRIETWKLGTIPEGSRFWFRVYSDIERWEPESYEVTEGVPETAFSWFTRVEVLDPKTRVFGVDWNDCEKIVEIDFNTYVLAETEQDARKVAMERWAQAKADYLWLPIMKSMAPDEYEDGLWFYNGKDLVVVGND